MAITLNGSAGVTTNSGAVYDSLQRGTAVTASGTSVDFTGIPSWAKRITVMFSGVSTSGTSAVQIQLGDAGGVETTGYNGVTLNSSSTLVANTNHSTGVLQDNSGAATYVRNGILQFTNLTGNTWVYAGLIGNSETTRSNQFSGSKTLSATLDSIRITTVNGTDTFDAGSINILYE